MKIGLMTWYKYHNYGSILQAYALSNIIKELNNDVFMINYVPRGQIYEDIEFNTRILTKKIIKKVKNLNLLKNSSNDNEKLFNDFISKNFKESAICMSYSELKELTNIYDIFVCGSDQIWSPLCFDKRYFLDFVDKNKIIAYAPSIGTDNIENKSIEYEMKNLINRFKYLSVREKQGVEIIKQITKKSANHVLDPTLLMSKKDWNVLANDDCVKKMPKKYLFCYFLGDYKKYMKSVKKIAKSKNLEIFVLSNVNLINNDKKYKIPFDVGPREFISLIKNASFVCTDSYHGTLFSVNYNKSFITFKRFKKKDKKNQNSRLYSFLELIKLDDKFVDKINDFTNLQIDYEVVNQILDIERNKSINFLSDSIKSINIQEKEVLPKYFLTDYCCGCGACAAVCKKNAIEIKYDENGFEHYKINKEKCINCGMCKKVCPILNLNIKNISESKKLYSFKSNNYNTLKTSSSGGFSHELANIYNKDYHVIGSCYNYLTNNAEHIIIVPGREDELYKIQGSKYIKSSTKEVFNEIYNTPKNNNKYLFIGTPCQAAAFKQLFQIKNKNDEIILVDLICHGIPTIYLWNKHLKEIKKKSKINSISNVLFRDKENGNWRERKITIRNNKKKYTNTEFDDNYFVFFKQGKCNMESCYECPYREKTAADIRIGDYWGEKFKKDKTGVSMVICATEKGKKIVEEMKKNNCGTFVENDIKEYWNVQFPSNVLKPLYWKKLIEEIKDNKKTLKQIRKKYCSYFDFNEKIKRIIKR